MFDDGIKTLEKSESLGASLLSRVLIPNRDKILERFFEIVLHIRPLTGIFFRMKSVPKMQYSMQYIE